MFCKSCKQLHSIQVWWGVAQSAVKFLNQARLAEPRLAHDQHQLPVALPRPLPAAHQHRDLFIAPDQGRRHALA